MRREALTMLSTGAVAANFVADSKSASEDTPQHRASRERRWKRYRVSPECLLDYLRRFDRMPAAIMAAELKGPPAGSQVEHVYWDPERCLMVVIVSHESFPPIPPGDKIPLGNGDWVRAESREILVRGVDGAYRVQGKGALA